MNEGKQEFVIDSDSKADWALEKIKQHKEEIREKEELADERINQIMYWLESETQSIEKNIEHLECLLAEYAKNIKENNPDFKTKKLPFGKIQYRSQRQKWHYKDDLLEYAESSMPDIVKIKKQIDKKKLKNKCEVVGGKVVNKETGEVITGVEVEERGEKLYIRTS